MPSFISRMTRPVLGRYDIIGLKMPRLWSLSKTLAHDAVVCIHRDGIGPVLSVEDAKKLVSPIANHSPTDAFDIHRLIKENYKLVRYGDRIYFETKGDARRVRDILRLLGRLSVQQAKAELGHEVFFFRDASDFPPGYHQ